MSTVPSEGTLRGSLLFAFRVVEAACSRVVPRSLKVSRRSQYVNPCIVVTWPVKRVRLWVLKMSLKRRSVRGGWQMSMRRNAWEAERRSAVRMLLVPSVNWETFVRTFWPLLASRVVQVRKITSTFVWRSLSSSSSWKRMGSEWSPVSRWTSMHLGSRGVYIMSLFHSGARNSLRRRWIEIWVAIRKPLQTSGILRRRVSSGRSIRMLSSSFAVWRAREAASRLRTDGSSVMLEIIQTTVGQKICQESQHCW